MSVIIRHRGKAMLVSPAIDSYGRRVVEQHQDVLFYFQPYVSLASNVSKKGSESIICIQTLFLIQFNENVCPNS